MFGADTGYLYLLFFLIALPMVAIVAAVVDRYLLHRRTGGVRPKIASGHAFEVIPFAKPADPEVPRSPGQSLR